jgi:hypothetical protein
MLSEQPGKEIANHPKSGSHSATPGLKVRITGYHLDFNIQQL